MSKAESPPRAWELDVALDHDIVRPFVAGTQEMMTMMLGIDCQVEPPAVRSFEGHVYGVIGLRGRARGLVALALPQASGRSLVGAMLGLPEEEIDDEILADGLGEMANIIAGHARTVLAETDYQFDLDIPQVFDARSWSERASTGPPLIACQISSDLGSFALGIHLEVSAPPITHEKGASKE